MDCNCIPAETAAVSVYSSQEHRYKYNCPVVVVGLAAWEGYNCLTEGKFEAAGVCHMRVEVAMMRGVSHYFVLWLVVVDCMNNQSAVVYFEVAFEM